MRQNQLLSKIVVPEIESKSQLVDTVSQRTIRCYQRSLFLKLKANHNTLRAGLVLGFVVIKDRCS